MTLPKLKSYDETHGVNLGDWNRLQGRTCLSETGRTQGPGLARALRRLRAATLRVRRDVQGTRLRSASRTASDESDPSGIPHLSLAQREPSTLGKPSDAIGAGQRAPTDRPAPTPTADGLPGVLQAGPRKVSRHLHQTCIRPVMNAPSFFRRHSELPTSNDQPPTKFHPPTTNATPNERQSAMAPRRYTGSR